MYKHFQVLVQTVPNTCADKSKCNNYILKDYVNILFLIKICPLLTSVNGLPPCKQIKVHRDQLLKEKRNSTNLFSEKYDFNLKVLQGTTASLINSLMQNL